MSTIFGFISQNNAIAPLSHLLSRHPEFGYRHLSALGGNKAGLWADPASGPQIALADALNAHDGDRLLARLDWSHDGDHAVGMSRDRIGVVLRGQIDNAVALARRLAESGYTSDPARPAALVADLIHWHESSLHDLTRAVQATRLDLQGIYAIGVSCGDDGRPLVFAASRIPLYLGLSIGGTACTDNVQLLPADRREQLRLHEGDVVSLYPAHVEVTDADGHAVRRTATLTLNADEALDRFGHHMEREIDAQPAMLADALSQRGAVPTLETLLSGDDGVAELAGIRAITLIASGSSHHAALTARYWLEARVGIPTLVELASEFRYRDVALLPGTLVIAISQSGETADTVASLRFARQLGATLTLAISNAADSTLMRQARWHLATNAGPEIAVTSTKTFTAQLLMLYQLALGLARLHGRLDADAEATARDRLAELPLRAHAVLSLKPLVDDWARTIAQAQALFCVGRHGNYPVVLEGAQKIREVAYLGAEGHAGGELKHGPLAVVDRNLPVVACLPWNRLAEKMLANLQEVRARQGRIYVFTDAALPSDDRMNVIRMPASLGDLDPLLYTLAFQLLAYRIALHRGTSIDTPRYLAKTVLTE
ncbi:glutamine--fructose-6-phosphate transaminase (isomerizing) [Jeongeupia chitinilytica]|uniref:Glutamine--fructose-6-phosphate aminotransferase [isomerizing] n=1 Tax=Jeongeupia chitinilytica TaxID=1041641 RepID=A0ABQ3GW67_9NEIS|nr:glutamine--fructose-6-phosphate transaminase (isomerizing) [Jeongeupia chitinilytica]GHD56431.1 glutamine--fructose-6-phosphate aminotransferase [isomerizing] [Jeongeupia chitinilytica]